MLHSKCTVTLFTNQHKSLTETHSHTQPHTTEKEHTLLPGTEHDLFRIQLVTCSYFISASDCEFSASTSNDNIKHNYNHCGHGLNCNYKGNYVAATNRNGNGNRAWREPGTSGGCGAGAIILVMPARQLKSVFKIYIQQRPLRHAST